VKPAPISHAGSRAKGPAGPLPPPPELAIDEQLPRAAVYSFSRVTVEDPGRWQTAMEELEPLRVEHGQVSKQVLQSTADRGPRARVPASALNGAPAQFERTPLGAEG
jgi:hypothetical protein